MPQHTQATRRPLRSWWPAPVAGLAALALYAHTLAPGFTWAHDGADGGDFLAAAVTRGVPHPPGYPLYQLLLRAVLAVFPGEPARVGNWLSAVCAAVAVALLADLARRMLAQDGRQPWRDIIALAAALAWAASPTLWSQATITEVYALNALAVVLLLWLLWRWGEAVTAERTGQGWLAGIGLTFGLGLGNHLSVALLAPAAGAWLWAHRRRVPHARAWGWPAALGLAVLGLSTYAYLPWAAGGDPPVNWGDPRTPARFVWAVSGRLYQELLFGIPWSLVPGRAAAWVTEAVRQLAGGPWGALIALAGLWRLDQRQHVWWRTTGLVTLCYSIYAIGYRTTDSFVYLIPAWGMVALWLAEGVTWGIVALAARLGRRGSETATGRRTSPFLLAAAALVLLPGISLARFWGENDLSHEHAAHDFITAALTEAEPESVVLVATDRPTFALWYAIYGRGQRTDIVPLNVHLYDYPWYRATLASHYPELSAGTRTGDELPALETLIATLAASRPVYRAEALKLELSGIADAAAETTPGAVLIKMRPEQ